MNGLPVHAHTPVHTLLTRMNVHASSYTHTCTYTLRQTHTVNDGYKSQERIIRTKFPVAFMTFPVTMAWQNQERKECLWLIISEGLACYSEVCVSRAAYAVLGADSVHVVKPSLC